MHAEIVPEMRFVSAPGDEERHRMIHQVSRSISTLSEERIVHTFSELRVRADTSGEGFGVENGGNQRAEPGTRTRQRDSE